MNDGDSTSPRRRNTFAQALEFVVDAQVSLGRHRGLDEGTIRRDINRAFDVALGDDDSRGPIDTAGEGPTGMMSLAGMFRLVFDEWGLDREDQFMQESWYAIANRAMEEALAMTRARDL
ncbi:hypothetical protein [Singulisphaera sp. PoT]|uniref:hypothetical protein n=1 Tax=Singulisphaera sp. PoT TaxID=3411797 RepID=UPI003BF54BB7